MKFLSILAVACFAIASPALAQAVVAPGAVDAGSIFTTLQPVITDAAVVIITAFAGWAATKFSAKTGIDIDAKHRDALHSAIVTGINLGIARAGEQLQGKQVQIGSPAAADAINWVNKSVPGALSHFGINQDTLRTMIEAKVPQVLGATASAPVTSKT